MQKNIFVTGGATGMGAAVVRRLVKSGCSVAFLDVNEEAGHELVQSLPANRAIFYKGTVANTATIFESIDAAAAALGGLDGLFTNAGIYQAKNLLEVSESEWDYVISINLKGTVFAVKAALPHLIQRGGGSVVLMASDQCFVGKSRCSAYGASKGAVGQFTKSTAVDFAAKGIRVNAVCPGTIRTPMAENAIQGWANREFGGDATRAWNIEAQEHLLGRVGTPEDVAGFVTFLLSDDSSFMTGGVYPIDGGLTAR